MKDENGSTLARRSLLVALGAAVVAAASRLRGKGSEATFVERTPPGNRHRTFSVGGHTVHIREDSVSAGWLRDFQTHPRGEAGR